MKHMIAGKKKEDRKKINTNSKLKKKEVKRQEFRHCGSGKQPRKDPKHKRENG